MVDILSADERKSDELCQKGIDLCAENELDQAHELFTKAYALAPLNPRALSWLGYTTALVNDQPQKGYQLCRDATAKEVPDPMFYRNLGVVAAQLNNRKAAIGAFAKGLRIDKGNRAILTAWKKIGMRRKPIIPFLSRDHWLNRWLGQKTWKKQR